MLAKAPNSLVKSRVVESVACVSLPKLKVREIVVVNLEISEFNLETMLARSLRNGRNVFALTNAPMNAPVYFVVPDNVRVIEVIIFVSVLVAAENTAVVLLLPPSLFTSDATVP